jgi:hypothetical protein
MMSSEEKEASTSDEEVGEGLEVQETDWDAGEVENIVNAHFKVIGDEYLFKNDDERLVDAPGADLDVDKEDSVAPFDVRLYWKLAEDARSTASSEPFDVRRYWQLAEDARRDQGPEQQLLQTPGYERSMFAKREEARLVEAAICNFCHNIACQAVRVPVCNHLYCSECLEHHRRLRLQTGRACLCFCGKQIHHTEIASDFRRLINDLYVSCPHCSFTGTLVQWNRHACPHDRAVLPERRRCDNSAMTV